MPSQRSFHRAKAWCNRPRRAFDRVEHEPDRQKPDQPKLKAVMSLNRTQRFSRQCRPKSINAQIKRSGLSRKPIANSDELQRTSHEPHLSTKRVCETPSCAFLPLQRFSEFESRFIGQLTCLPRDASRLSQPHGALLSNTFPGLFRPGSTLGVSTLQRFFPFGR